MSPRLWKPVQEKLQEMWQVFSPLRNYFTLGTRGFSVFSRIFGTSSAVGRSHERRSAGHYKDLTETGNRARKVSDTQGTTI